MNDQLKINYRNIVIPADVGIVAEIVKSTGFFNKEEIDVATGLVEDCLENGEKSGYLFLFAELNGRSVAYSCYGPIPGTHSSFDVYWLATHNDFRGKGIGKILMAETENRIAQLKGKNIYVETASKPQYEPTRKFYENCGYVIEARLKDFYASDDDKLIYVKRV